MGVDPDVLKRMDPVISLGETELAAQITQEAGADSKPAGLAALAGEQGVEAVGVIAKGRGRKSWLPAGTVAEVVRITQHERAPGGSTHWTTRSLARRLGIGKDAVARIWADHQLKPWKVESFKISNDPHFGAKLVDVVGLYLNPPEKAADVLGFFKRIDASVARDLDVHVVLDNLSTHKAPEIRRWLANPRRKRWHLHFTPTSSSWVNLVERWFRELTDKRLRRGAFTSVADLISAIETWAAAWNEHPKPFVWHTPAAVIIEKVRRGRATLRQIKSQTDH